MDLVLIDAGTIGRGKLVFFSLMVILGVGSNGLLHRI
jgi:hypothetical protein